MHVPCLMEISVLSNLIFCSLKFDGYVGVRDFISHVRVFKVGRLQRVVCWTSAVLLR